MSEADRDLIEMQKTDAEIYTDTDVVVKACDADLSADIQSDRFGSDLGDRFSCGTGQCAFFVMAVADDTFSLRGNDASFDDLAYGRDELTAEIGSSLLLYSSGLEIKEADDNTDAQCQKWIAAMQNDLRLIVNACSAAQKASEYVLKNVI